MSCSTSSTATPASAISRRTLYESPGNAPCEHDEHARIVDLIEKGDAAAAAEVMTAHLDTLEQRVSVAHARSEKSLAGMLGL